MSALRKGGCERLLTGDYIHRESYIGREEVRDDIQRITLREGGSGRLLT